MSSQASKKSLKSTINCDKLNIKKREELENEKRDFLNDRRSSYYTGKITLAPPMELDKIEKFEKENDLTLPYKFRKYLLTVSSETMGYYPHIIELDDMDYFFINTITNDEIIRDAIEDIEDDEKELENFKNKYNEENGYYINIFIRLFVHGCTFDDYLCIKGPKKGELWGYFNGGYDFHPVDKYYDIYSEND